MAAPLTEAIDLMRGSRGAGAGACAICGKPTAPARSVSVRGVGMHPWCLAYRSRGGSNRSLRFRP